MQIGADLLVALNKWRQVLVDQIRERHGVLSPEEGVRERLIATIEQASDLLAQAQLLGTESMRALSEETVAFFKDRGRSAIGTSEPMSSDEIDEISRELADKRRELQEALRGV